jgi:hypothetical protein
MGFKKHLSFLNSKKIKAYEVLVRKSGKKTLFLKSRPRPKIPLK